MPDDLDSVLNSVGPRLRAIRRRRNVTLAVLAKVTGISVSTLSRLESGTRKPSLELLLPLASAHQIALDELIGTAPASPPPPQHKPIAHKTGIIIPLNERPGGLRATKEIFPADRVDWTPDPQVHQGYKWLCVLDGQLRLVLGDHDVVVRPGETAEFDTRLPHWFSPAERRPVEIISLFGPQGERMRVKARPRSN